MKQIKSALLALCIGLISAEAAWAGSGAGAVNDVTGTALSGFDAVSYFESDGPVQGIPKYRTSYNGVDYLFATPEHLAAFVANPEHYAPQFGGFCAAAVAYGQKVTIDPHEFKVVDGKLYVNHSVKAQALFEKDPAAMIRKANENWPEVQKIDGPSK